MGDAALARDGEGWNELRPLRPCSESWEHEVVLHIRLRCLAGVQDGVSLVVWDGAFVRPDAEPQVLAHLEVDLRIVAVDDGRLVVERADELLVGAEAVAHGARVLSELELLRVLLRGVVESVTAASRMLYVLTVPRCWMLGRLTQTHEG